MQLRSLKAIALGATWDVDLVKRAARIIARESRAMGVHHCCTPMIGVARYPRWGGIPVTVPRNVGQVPCFCSSLPPGRPGRYFNSPVEPLYVRDVVSSLSRPDRELKGFSRLILEPGESKELCFDIGFDQLAMYCHRVHDWVVEPGEFDIMVGSSCMDIRLESRLTVSR